MPGAHAFFAPPHPPHLSFSPNMRFNNANTNTKGLEILLTLPIIIYRHLKMPLLPYFDIVIAEKIDLQALDTKLQAVLLTLDSNLVI